MDNFDSYIQKGRVKIRLKNLIVECVSGLGVISIWSLIIFFFGYVLWYGYSSISEFGFKNIFSNIQFSLNDKDEKTSFWAPFATTIFLAFVVSIVSIPISRRCAAFIFFSIKKRYRRIISGILLFFSNLPSIILGIFSKNYLAPVIQKIFGLENSMNLIAAIASLVFMILPLTISLFLSEFKQHKNMVECSNVLGLSKTQSMYKLIFPKTTKTIFTVSSIVVARVFNESVMLSLLLSSENYNQIYGKPFGIFINSQLNSIAPLISSNFYSDGSEGKLQNLMLLFGGLLIWSSILFNIICFICAKIFFRKRKESGRLSIFKKLRWHLFDRWIFDNKNLEIYIYQKHFICKLAEKIRKGIEILLISSYCLFICSLLGISIFRGVISIANGGGGDPEGLKRAMVNVFYIVIISMLCAVPISLMASYFLSEQCKEHSKFKKATLSLINSGASSPSILFGIFGFSFFIQKLGLSSAGIKGKSLLAGLITITMLIIPHLTKLFYDTLSSISNKYRISAYILGIDRLGVFTKIILPKTINDLIFSGLFVVGRTIGETIPFSLTAGVNNSPKTRLMYPGQTLTTRIHSQIFELDLKKSSNIIDETTFYCLLLVAFFVLIGKWGVPYMNKRSIGKLLNFLKIKKFENEETNCAYE